MKVVHTEIVDDNETVGYGTNPCSEIILRDRQFCNLSEVVVRSTDTIEDLKRKVRLATILGTLQATLTNFRYLSSAWKKNTEEEALLGVSLTGIMDHWGLSSLLQEYTLSSTLEELKNVAIRTNKEWAGYLGINPAAAITCVKPSGTVSQLVDSASGIHPRYAPYYIRTVRADKKDPLAQFMKDVGFPCEDDVTKPESTYVFSFPIAAPSNSVFRDDRTAIEQLELWRLYQDSWCEHKPSITVYVKEHEWPEVGAWVWRNFDDVSGVSFLPHSEHTYRQAPYQEITEEEYAAFCAKMPKDVDWSGLGKYETEDRTAGAQTLACSGVSCEIVDLTEG
jgi:ribonucleoside-diphosphate reductase alpha chain